MIRGRNVIQIRLETPLKISTEGRTGVCVGGGEGFSGTVHERKKIEDHGLRI